MDRDKAREIILAVNDMSDTEEMLDKLEKMGLLDEPCKKHTILDEEWSEYEGDVHRPDGGTIYIDDWRKEIAALPDVLRALVIVKCKRQEVVRPDGTIIIELTKEDRGAIRDALKKAGM